MKIWLFNNYCMIPSEGPMTRTYYFAKHLHEMGHEPVVFSGSYIHNVGQQMIEGKEPYSVAGGKTPFPWVYVRTASYRSNRKKQVFTMFQYYWNAKKASKVFDRPDVILGSSAHPLAALLAVRLARKYGCRSVVEVRDLWPESIVAFGIAGPHNPAVIALRWLEKWLYKHADAVVFTQEGAYDYIVERGWEKDVPRSKVHYINNGVDLATFQYDCDHFQLKDPDLEDTESFKLVYTGSIRKANGLSQLLECAELLRDHPKIRFLVYGSGDDLGNLQEACRKKGLDNIRFKGQVKKENVPYILSKSDVNLLNYAAESSAVFRFGNSQNKLFEYLASGKPVLTNVKISYDPADRNRCCFAAASCSAEDYAKAVLELYELSQKEYEAVCRRARETAEEYDFRKLTQKLVQVIEECT